MKKLAFAHVGACNQTASEVTSFRKRLRAADFAQFKLFAVVGVVLIMALAFLLPNFAHAGFLGDLMNDMLATLLAPIIHSMSEAIDNLYKMIFDINSIVNDIKGGRSWTELLGSGDAGLYNAIMGMQNTVIIPIAMQILTLGMMFKLFAISKIAESQDMQPLVPKISVVLIMYFLAMYLVQNAAGIITIGYDMIQHMITGIANNSTIEMNWIIEEQTVKDSEAGVLGAAILFVFFALFQLLVCCVTWIVAVFMYYGKVITLYIQAFFAPIPIALIGIDNMKSWAYGFIRNVGSTLLSLVIIFLILTLFPLIMQAVISAGGWGLEGSVGATLWTALTNADSNWLAIVLSSIALNVLLIFMLVKSGGMAKEILGA